MSDIQAAVTPATDPVVIIGAGPAGMNAAILLGESDQPVIVLDKHKTPGGTVFANVTEVSADVHRSQFMGKDYAVGLELVQAFNHLVEEGFIDYRPESTYLKADDKQVFWLDKNSQEQQQLCSSLVLASGAKERISPIAGMSLAGVNMAGALLQRLKLDTQSLPPAHSVLVGCGPLLYQLACVMIDLGQPPKAIVETQTGKDLFAALRYWPRKSAGQNLVWRGLKMLTKIRVAGVKRYKGAKGIALLGDDKLQQVVFSVGGKQHSVDADAVFLHTGIVPNVEYSQDLGLPHHYDHEIQSQVVQRDQFGRTELPWVYVAGESSYIMGSDAAAVHGRLMAQVMLLEKFDHYLAGLNRVWKQKLAGLEGRQFINRLYRLPDWLK